MSKRTPETVATHNLGDVAIIPLTDLARAESVTVQVLLTTAARLGILPKATPVSRRRLFTFNDASRLVTALRAAP